HVNEHGITFQEYRFNEYKNQIEKIAFYLGHETVAKWYGDYAVNAAYRLALHVHSNSLDNHSLLSSTDSKNDWHRSTIRVAPS
ncbi:hypothetical protein ACSLOE_30645, partial [Escherichia coli]